MPEHVKRAHDNALKPFNPHEEDNDIEENQERPNKKSRSTNKEEGAGEASSNPSPPPKVTE